MNSGLTFWSLEWSLWVLALAASLLGLYAWLSSVILLSKMLLKDAWKNYWRKRASDVATTTRTGFTGIEVAGLVTVCSILSFVTGFMARDVKQFNHTATYFNVLVMKHPQTRVYTLKISGQDNAIKFCNYIPDWDIGSTLEWVRWEDTGPCKNIDPPTFGFHVVRDEFKHPVITAVKGEVP